MSTQLQEKITASQQVIKKTLKKYPNSSAVAWTGGKDSTVLLHMIRSVHQKSLPIMFIDTKLHFSETIAFVKKMESDWNLNLIIASDESGYKKYQKTRRKKDRKELARMMKVNAIDQSINKYKWQALFVGIRWDEHPARAAEKYVSLRSDHVRIHPILHFTEQDIWAYIRQFKLPYNPLYDQGYRSLGEKEFTKPVPDKTQPERAGREKDKEKIMERLRSLGYF